MMTLSAGLVGAVWMALDHPLFKHTQQMHLVKSGKKKPRGREMGEEEEV